MDDDDDILLKVLVVGDVAVGKTSLIHRYTNDEFKEDYKTTIGVEFALKPIEIDDRDINIQLVRKSIKQLTRHIRSLSYSLTGPVPITFYGSCSGT